MNYNFICNDHNMQPREKMLRNDIQGDQPRWRLFLTVFGGKYMYKPPRVQVRNREIVFSGSWKGIGKICQRTKHQKTRNGKERRGI